MVFFESWDCKNYGCIRGDDVDICPVVKKSKLKICYTSRRQDTMHHHHMMHSYY